MGKPVGLRHLDPIRPVDPHPENSVSDAMESSSLWSPEIPQTLPAESRRSGAARSSGSSPASCKKGPHDRPTGPPKLGAQGSAGMRVSARAPRWAAITPHLGVKMPANGQNNCDHGEPFTTLNGSSDVPVSHPGAAQRVANNDKHPCK